MKKVTLLIGGFSCFCGLTGQVLLQENFTAQFNPAANGWNVQNLSVSPNATQTAWFQGSGAVFPAFNGGANDFYASNFMSTSDPNPATISTWLITPTLTVANGAVLEFATRTTTNPSSFPDRLQVYLSTAGAGTNVGTTPTSLGTFSTLLVAINPNLTSTGYPGVWTIYTATITGIPSPVTGRIGFRYFVTGSGSAGAFGDYIGIDAVKFTSSCPVSVQSYTTCAGQSLTLTANGGGANTTYTWSPVSSNSSSIVVSPGSTTQYTLDYSTPNATCPAVHATITVSSTLNVNVSASHKSVCPGESATLTASGPATSYTWINTMANGTEVTVSPSSTTIYTVAGSSGVFPSSFCLGASTIELFVFPQPVITGTVAPAVVCTGKSFTLSASGGVDYVWIVPPGTFSNTNQLVITGTVAGSTTYSLLGVDNNGCVDVDLVNVDVHPAPVLTVSANQGTMCVGDENTLTAVGASTYAWTGAATAGSGSFVYSPATSGTKNFTVTGTSAEGCTSQTMLSVAVDVCAGIDKFDNLEGLTAFPNPFSNVITVSGFAGTATVYNMLGAIVLEVQVKGAAVINTSELPKGSYLIQARAANGEVIQTTNIVRN